MQLSQKLREVRWIILPVTIQRHDDRVRRGLDAGPQRGTLSGIAFVAQPIHDSMPIVGFTNSFPRRIRARVIDKENFISAPELLHHGDEFIGERQDVVLLIEDWNNDNYFRLLVYHIGSS